MMNMKRKNDYPLRILILTAFIAVFLAGADVVHAGRLVAWGLNTNGQCDAPVGEDYIEVAAGSYHCVALRENGSLTAWGLNYYGQCNVPSGYDFTMISASGHHSVALSGDGTVHAWGSNTYGESEVPDGYYKAVAAGQKHGVAVREDGTIVAWGDNTYGQCDVPAGDDYVNVAAGTYTSYAIRQDGTITAWGENIYNLLEVPEDTNFKKLSCGTHHVCALDGNGDLSVWGSNSYGQLDLPSDIRYKSIGAGIMHSIGLEENGSLVGAGMDFSDVLQFPALNAQEQYTAVAVGGFHNVAVVDIPMIDAKLRVLPRCLNIDSRGRWVRALVKLEDGHLVQEIDANTVTLNGIKSERAIMCPHGRGAYFKFRRKEFSQTLEAGKMQIKIAGKLKNEMSFEGTDMIKVVDNRDRRARWRRLFNFLRTLAKCRR